MKKLTSAAAVALLLLSGCASMTPDQCRVADWYQVGVEDGSAGHGAQQKLGEYAQDCAEVGVRPDTARFQQGWETGILRYCTPYTGWSEGTRGRSQQLDMCRGRPQEGGFQFALRAGLEVYRTRQSMDSNEREIRRQEQRLQDKNTTESQRREARDRIRYLDFEQSRLRRTLQDQERLAP